MIKETLREIVSRKRDIILNRDLSPIEASRMLVEFSALMGNATEEIRIREFRYNTVLAETLAVEKSAVRAEVMAKITPEYRRLRRAKDLEKVLMELIRGLKYYLRARGNEYEASGNM